MIRLSLPIEQPFVTALCPWKESVIGPVQAGMGPSQARRNPRWRHHETDFRLFIGTHFVSWTSTNRRFKEGELALRLQTRNGCTMVSTVMKGAIIQ